MADLGIIGSIGIMIVTATLVILLARRLNVPSIVLYIVTGLLLGPIGLDLLSIELGHDGHGETAVAVAAELGIVLLLFLVGLELSLDKIKAVGKVAIAAGLGQVVFTAVIGFGLAFLLGFDLMASIFLATALTFSSTVVVVKLLDQKRPFAQVIRPYCRWYLPGSRPGGYRCSSPFWPAWATRKL
jgi:Kef-type K+ transport system membrane component KefB